MTSSRGRKTDEALAKREEIAQATSGSFSKKNRTSLAAQVSEKHVTIFGLTLEELFARESGNVPYFFLRMIQYLEEKGKTSFSNNASKAA